jgi:hypothetical protein
VHGEFGHNLLHLCDFLVFADVEILVIPDACMEIILVFCIHIIHGVGKEIARFGVRDGRAVQRV